MIMEFSTSQLGKTNFKLNKVFQNDLDESKLKPQPLHTIEDWSKANSQISYNI